MATQDEQVLTMLSNLQSNTGRDITWWMDTVVASGLEKHSERITYLKTEHELGHGFANLIVTLAKRRESGGPVSDANLIEAQYEGKEQLRPIYDAIMSIVEGFGDELEVAPKKASVSLRRSKQFALIQPATKTRVDLGLNLRGDDPTERLEAWTGMCTHRVRLTSADEVDAEVEALLREAFDRA